MSKRIFIRHKKNSIYKMRKTKYKKVQELKTFITNLFAVISAICIIIFGFIYVFNLRKQIKIDINNVAEFNIPYTTFKNLKELCEENSMNFNEIITLYSLNNRFIWDKKSIPTKSDINNEFLKKYEKIKSTYSKLLDSYMPMFTNIFKELENFPILLTANQGEEGDIVYIYGNSWIKGENESTSIIDRENISGRIAIVSMTSGMVKKLSWDKNDGYYVIIETSSNTQYYYLHLESIELDLKVGDIIEAGKLIGYMGNTGYKKSKTSKLVSLEVKIKPNVKFTEDEFFINPYIFLRDLELKKIITKK